MTGNYAQDGYQVVRQAISLAELEPFRDTLRDRVGAYARQLFDAGKIASLHEDLPFGRRLAAVHAAKELRGLGGWQLPPIGPELLALIRHPAIVDALEPHLGPHITCNGDHMVRISLPGSETTVFRLHQDSQYYGEPTQHAHIITVWIPLVDVDEGNGCLYVIPGSHRWGLIGSARDENNRMRSFEDVEARAAPVPVPMKLGDILLFSNMTFHGSKVNLSDAVRFSLDIRYVRTPGSYAASELERAGEEFMFEKVMRSKGIAPMVVRGDETPRVENKP